MITFESVSKRFEDGTQAVRELSLSMPSHEITVLVGSSGSGKTTLLRMVNRMVDPTSGRVLIDDEDVATLNPVSLRRRIGYVLQGGGLLPHKRIIDNIITVLRLTGTPRKAAIARGMELMDVVGLDPASANRFPSQLSGGQQQRVGVARALATDPNILLMDEPFGAVDPIVRSELQEELLRLQTALGKTVVFVTHDIDEAFLLGDHVALLSPGGVVEQHDRPENILAAPANDFVSSFIGSDRGKRTLRISERDGQRVVVDSRGRPAGILAEEGN